VLICLGLYVLVEENFGSGRGLRRVVGHAEAEMQAVSGLLESLLKVQRGSVNGVFALSEEESSDEEVEIVIEAPVFDVLGDMYVCSSCGGRLTEIPTYNRFYCENCGLHY
jgi:hypothetical protein